ncbi:MAG TPA: tetratricopeptide repeat protein [Terriglobia bacterium]|jgi:tetratricopeptide (TPR) repeat protein
MTICRTAGSVEFDGLYISGLKDLITRLSVDDPRAECLFADLSLGAWFVHMAAQQFFLQLGILPPEHIRPTREGSAYWDQVPEYADRVGNEIDSETSGDRVLMTSLELAEQVIEAIGQKRPQTLVIIAPRFDFDWEAENELFLEFLVMGLRDTASRCILAFMDEKPPAVPEKWKINWLNSPAPTANEHPELSPELLTLVPGIVEPALAEMLAGTAPLDKSRHLSVANGGVLVAPEYRRNPNEVSKAAYDELGQKAEAIGWLKSYCQLYGNLQFLNVYFLRQQSSQRFAEGAYNVAFRLIQPVLQHSFHPFHKTAALLEAQGMRVALKRFKDASEMPDPPRAAPPPILGALFLSKAWGLVMIDQPEQAEPYFEQARNLLKPFQDRFYLYLLNIAALNKLRLGQADAAFELEREIEQTLSESPKKDWHLEYINCLNLGRLFRRSGDFELSEKYYSKSFYASEGIRSDSDLVYSNVSWAGLYQKNNPDLSFLHWFRAALHWAATAVPEALTARAIRPIVGRNLKPGEDLTEELSKGLISFIYQSAKAARIPLKAFDNDMESTAGEGSKQITFIHSDNLPAGTIEYAFGFPGWSVLATKQVFKRRFKGKYYDRLNDILVRAIEEWCPAVAKADVRTLIVDTMMGCEMPITFDQLRNTCVRLKIPHLHFENRSEDLSGEECRSLERNAVVRIGSGVSHISDADGRLTIHFKRYVGPVTLSEEDSKIVRLVDGVRTVDEIASSSGNPGSGETGVLQSLRSLEILRVTAIS